MSLARLSSYVFSLRMRRPPTSPLFPYTTLFRSRGGRGDRVLLEQGGVVVQDHRLGVVVGHAVLGAVDLADSADRLDGAREDVDDLAGQVHYGVAGHVVGQGASGPVEHQGGGVAGADRGADLLLVGGVGEELHGEDRKSVV